MPDDAVADLLGRHFARAESYRRAIDYLAGLLHHATRRNGARLDNGGGHVARPSADGVQWLLNGAAWDPEALRDDMFRYVGRAVGEGSAVVAVRDVGFGKKGTKSVGVDRQWNHLTGRNENCQVAVFAAYASRSGRALVDRELYLPQAWAADDERRRLAGVPPSLGYASKAALAGTMIERLCQLRVPFQWVTAGAPYGEDRELRETCERRHLGYVFGVRPDERVRLAPDHVIAVGEVGALVPGHGFERHSAVEPGGGGTRDWAIVPLASHGVPGRRALLVSRRDGQPGPDAFHLCYAPLGAALGELTRVAQAQPAVLDCIDEARRCAGLDGYEVRKYVAWYRHMTLALVAAAFLAVRRSMLGGTDVTIP